MSSGQGDLVSISKMQEKKSDSQNKPQNWKQNTYPVKKELKPKPQKNLTWALKQHQKEPNPSNWVSIKQTTSTQS